MEAGKNRVGSKQKREKESMREMDLWSERWSIIENRKQYMQLSLSLSRVYWITLKKLGTCTLACFERRKKL
jgi:hypothetical protein